MGKNKIEKEQAPLLTEQEVWDVIEFARSLYGASVNGIGYVNPELINARMRDVTLNPLQATQDELDTAMKNPKENEKKLQAISQDFEVRSMIYKRLISYLANMLSFDITYTCKNVKTPEDYRTPKYKKDMETIEKFLDRFDYKKELRVVVREMLRNDAFFGCLVDTGNKYVLQELPSEYCKITGRWENGFLFSFNMYWFMQPGVNIDAYPPFFKKKFKEIWQKENGGRIYDPSLPPELRGRSSWIYWVDVPVSFGVCFKLSPELATRLPYFTPLFNDLVLQALMRNLQKNINMAAASKMIVGEVPMLNKETKATLKDSIAVSPDLLGKFLALLKSSLSEAIKVASAPLANMQGISFDGDNDMFDSYQRTTLATTGVNTNLIFSSQAKPNSIETQLSLNVDEQLMTNLYEQFNEFMEYYANKHTRNYKFKFAFEGTEFFLNRQARLDTAMSLFDKGIVMPQKIAAAVGMKPAEMRRHMEEAQAFGFMDMLTPPAFEQQKEMADITTEDTKEIAEVSAKLAPKPVAPASKTAKPKTSTTTKKGSGEKGRPKKKLSELGDEGLKTRDGAGNVGRGGKVN